MRVAMCSNVPYRQIQQYSTLSNPVINLMCCATQKHHDTYTYAATGENTNDGVLTHMNLPDKQTDIRAIS